ncbi:MAG: protein tyrosine phosphatase [Clostridia bacterium]|nr:protein tyrosine phosphatase [Clostridia bacterium]
MRMNRVVSILILVLLLACTANGLAENSSACFFRFDMNDADAWQHPLANVRFLTEGAWNLVPLDPASLEKYGISQDTWPSTEGLDTLHISGSAEFSENQFRQLAEDLRRLAGDRPIFIIDCRMESHALVNGMSISWYGEHNWANKGLSLAEAEADEMARFGSLPGSMIMAYTAENDMPANPQEISVERTMTERELVESEGFQYLRLAANDHSWPEEEAVDAFLSFVDECDRTAGLENVWLHFHCHAGKSRTVIFMAIYDMIRNPSVSFEDIMLRQAMAGGSYLPYASPNELQDVYALRAQRIRQVYDYLHSPQYLEKQMSWSAWVAKD